MQNEKWHCDRCSKPCDYEDPSNLGIWLSSDANEVKIGKITTGKAYEKVCTTCGDDFYAIAKSCSKDCANCPATQVWGLSVIECLSFQKMHDLLDIEKTQTAIQMHTIPFSSIFASVFEQFRIKTECENLQGMLLSNRPDHAAFAKKAWELKDNF
jgi:hypothetical protein